MHPPHSKPDPTATENGKSARRSLASRIAWLGVVIAVPAVLAWANQHAGGVVPAEVSCAFAATRISEPPADIVIFGSSRTGTALDPRAIEGMLNARDDGNPVRVDRLNITGPDNLASVSMLERYLETRGAPKVVVAEVMLKLKQRKRPPRRGLYGRRHYSLLPYGDLGRYHELVYNDEDGHRSLLLNLKYAYSRTVALLHGLVRDPLGRNWDLQYCTEGDRTRDGVWSMAEQSQLHPPMEQIAIERSRLTALERVTDNTDWIWGADGPEIADYDIHARDRIPEIAMKRYLVEFAAKHEMEVVFVPLVNYASTVAPEDRAFFESLGDNVHWVDLYARAGDILEPNWRDPLHVHTRASTLVSAYLAQALIPVLDR